MRVNTNAAALHSHRLLSANSRALDRSLEKLASGLRINKASDDAAGLAISEHKLVLVKGMAVAAQNAQDGIGVLHTAEGALHETSVILQRMRELAVRAGNDTLTSSDRQNIQVEVGQLSAEIDRIAGTTEFNTKNLLNGNLASQGMTLQIGASAGQVLNFRIGTFTAAALTVGTAQLDISTSAAVSNTIATLDVAINRITSERAMLGAIAARLDHAISNLHVGVETHSVTLSRIRDLDMAREVANLSRIQILQQSSTAMLAQANQVPQAVLGLLR